MSIIHHLEEEEEELVQYEEELARNPLSVKVWWQYLMAGGDWRMNKKKRLGIYERAVKALPGSYKLWYGYLSERLDIVRQLPMSDYESLNNSFERALVTMHKMPRIWIMYLQFLTEQKLVTRTRRTFDRALCALPVSQHDRIWELYLVFVRQRGMPIETSVRVYRRYLKFDPTHVEDYIEFLVNSRLWLECAEMLASLLMNEEDAFVSIKGKTKHEMWLDLCDLLGEHATEVSGHLKVDAIIRCGISKFPDDDVGRMWTSLAEYYIRMNLHEKVRGIYEEGMASVVRMRDFCIIWDAYAEFEQTILDISTDEDQDIEEEEDARLNLSIHRLDRLIERRPELANNVVIKQNPHNVEQWHRRVKLFEGNPRKQITTYTEAVTTVDPMKAVGGKPHTLWVAFAKLYETRWEIGNARDVFDKAVQQVKFSVYDLASVWCEWAEMEIRHGNFRKSLDLMKRATSSGEQGRKSVRLWSLYVDVEANLGSLESTRGVYEQILDLKVATPQIIINYAALLEENNYFEDAFKVYERGINIFRYPHTKAIWETYICKFVKRYGKSKLERSRELFERAIQMTPAADDDDDQVVKRLYLEYAKLEEDYGVAKRAMRVYERATKVVREQDKIGVYEIYIARAAQIFGVGTTREIYEEAIQCGVLQDKDVKSMCVKYAELEKGLGEMERARGIYVFGASQLEFAADYGDFWNKWQEFEVQHGNEDTFREMLRIKRSVVSARQGNNRTSVVIRQAKTMTTDKTSGDIQLPDEEEEEEVQVVVEEKKNIPLPESCVYRSDRSLRRMREFEGARQRFKRQKLLGH